MPDPLQRRLLAREIELMTSFALGVASDLERAAGSGDLPDTRILVRALFSGALKISRLLWPFGRRAGDDLAVEVAGEMRARLGLDDSHPLAPVKALRLADALRLNGRQLDEAIEPEQRRLLLHGEVIAFDALVDAIRSIHQGVHRPEPE